MTTTSKLGDFLGRALVNDNPGTSDATDYLGRSVTASNKDFAGRSLTDNPQFPPAARALNTAYSVGDIRRIVGIKEVQTLTASGSPTGTMKLDCTLHGETKTTGDITIAGMTGATITTALVALSNVNPGDVVVTGSSSPFTATFQEELGNVAPLAVNTQPTGGTYAVTTATAGTSRDEIYQVTTAGTSHASTTPASVAVGASTATDGTVVWKRLK